MDKTKPQGDKTTVEKMTWQIGKTTQKTRYGHTDIRELLWGQSGLDLGQESHSANLRT